MKITKSDKHPIECRVFIDVKNGKIDFQHIIQLRGRFWYAINMVSPTIQSFTFCLLLIFLPPYIVWIALLSVQGEYTLIWASIIIILSMLYIPHLFSVPLSFIPSFTEKIFPKFGALTHMLTGNLKELLVYDTYGKKSYIIPDFNNAFMEYEARGDFADYLKNIEIVENDYFLLSLRKKKWNRCSNWKAIFYFDEVPMNGFLKLKFV